MFFSKSEKESTYQEEREIDFIGIAKANTLIAIFFSLFIFLFFGLVAIFNADFNKKDIKNVDSNIQVQDDSTKSGLLGIFVSSNFAKPIKVSNQNVQSGIKGIFVSEVFSKPQYSSINSFEKGVFVSSNFAKVDKKEAKSELFAAVTLLESMENTLALDVNKEIINAPNRGTALEKQLSNLESLSTSGSEVLTKITSEKAKVENAWGASAKLSDAKQKSFFNEFDQFSPGSSEALFEEFIKEKKNTVEQRANLGVLMALEERFNYLIPKINEKVANIKSNRESIILGMNCVANK